ncbi:hypothetical protein AB0M46_31330 [Dactylosporangium sp. NPDC051485]|uniref:hypothetical protein n=1 Tax=Dactylosporangium sp. NPDC051485 TaxID=3154846 RepID=UPI00342AF59B
MAVLLFGANPGLTLFAGDDRRPVAFASVWRVDWSVRGAGRALVLWHEGRPRVLTEAPELGHWVAEAFVRHFPEVDGLPWPEPEVLEAPVRLELDHATGVRAEAADVRLDISGPLDRRVIEVARFPGNGLRLRNVYVPCHAGTLHVAGVAVPGAPRVTAAPRPSSTAFLADAEVWSDGP